MRQRPCLTEHNTQRSPSPRHATDQLALIGNSCAVKHAGATLESMRRASMMKAGVLLMVAVTTGGCATYHQPRYSGDGVYYDQWHAAPRQVVVVDPMFYPFWSLDFFYFSHFHRPYRPLFFAHDPWFFHDPWFYPRRGWATGVVWSHPIVYQSPRPDQRLFLLQEARAPVRPPRLAHRHDSGLVPGSEVQLRQRLAEDRAAAASRARPTESRRSADGISSGRKIGRPSERGERLRPAAPRQAPASRPVPRSTPPPRSRPTSPATRDRRSTDSSTADTGRSAEQRGLDVSALRTREALPATSAQRSTPQPVERARIPARSAAPRRDSSATSVPALPRERRPEVRIPAQRAAPPPRQTEPSPRTPSALRSPRERQSDR